MRSDSRQCPAKSETVGQEDVRAFHSEFLSVILLSQHNIADERFSRRYQSVRCVPATSGNVPAAFPDVLLHFFVLCRIVLLHPGIFHSAFKVEYIVRILFQQKQVLVDRVPYILFNGSLYIPVPLSVQMGICYHVGFRLFLLFVPLGVRVSSG